MYLNRGEIEYTNKLKFKLESLLVEMDTEFV